MSEQQEGRSINFSSFADWCQHKDNLSESARHTVEVLLKEAGTSDCYEADKILSNLTELSLYNCKITDITPLSALTNLTYLYLEYNQITDLTGISRLTYLESLHLSNNPITDISPLSQLENLTKLSLISDRITNLYVLSALTNLAELYLDNNKMTDLTGLSGLTSLSILYLHNNRITDITPLSGLTNLTRLYLHHNQITDITALSGLTNLTDLYLNNNQITDVTALSELTNLTDLYLNNNQITDVTALSELIKLKELDLRDNEITDLTALLQLLNLKKLYLHNNPIADLNLPIELVQKYFTRSTVPIDVLTTKETAKQLYAAIDRELPEFIVCSSPQVFSAKLLEQLTIYSTQNPKSSVIEPGYLEWGKSLFEEIFQSIDAGLSRAFWKFMFEIIVLDPDVDRLLVFEVEELVETYPEPQRYYSYRSGCNYLTPISSQDLVKEIYLTELFISKLGIALNEKARELFRCKQQLLENCGWIFPFEKVCLVCDRPQKTRFDSENRLHAEGESAIEFADGWCLYFHHGVKLPEKYGKVHPDLWQSEWLLSETNAEMRRVLIQRIGYARICQELQATELDCWGEYTLLRIDADLDGLTEDDDDIDSEDLEPVILLKMTCPSTGFIHALRVPPDVASAREAIRWVNWDIDSEEFSMQT